MRKYFRPAQTSVTVALNKLEYSIRAAREPAKCEYRSCSEYVIDAKHMFRIV